VAVTISEVGAALAAERVVRAPVRRVLGIVAEGDATLAQPPDRRVERLGREPDREVERGGLRHPHERERPAVEHE